jgi:chain length determinant protein EpsF
MSFQRLLLILRGRIRLIFLSFSMIVGITLAVNLLMPEKFKAETDIVVNTAMPDPVVGTQIPAMMSTNYVATQTSIISSHHVALGVVNKLGLRTNASAMEQWRENAGGKGDIGDWLADALLKNLDVQPGRDSNVIAITYEATDPKFAADVANMFAQEYIQTSLELVIQPARQTSLFFDTQLKSLRDRAEKAQTRLSEYQRHRGITSNDDRLDVEQTRLEGLSNQLIGAQGQTYDLQSRVTQVGTTTEINDNMPEVLSNSLIQQLKRLIAENEAKLTVLSNDVGTKHPRYQSAQNELNDLKRRLALETNKIVSSIKTTAVAAREREMAAHNALEAQRSKILAMKKLQSERAVLQRDVENAQHAYDFALQRASQTNLQGQLSQTNIAVLNLAVPPIDPASPKLLRNLALSVLFGSMLAISAALVVEMLGRIVRAPVDIEIDLGVPVFGILKRSALPRHRWCRVAPSQGLAFTLAEEARQ